MQKKHNFKSEESAARERAHQFGQPNGNKPCAPSTAASQRAFYRWVETNATEQELQDYVRDERNPYARRKFVAALQRCGTVQDFFDLTNQTHGMPKQVIEQTDLPRINIVLE
jgi:hypothetical protein